MLCSGIVAIVEEKCPELLQKAKDTYKRFTEVLTQYAKCYNVFNGGVVDGITIDQLGGQRSCFELYSLLQVPFQVSHTS